MHISLKSTNFFSTFGCFFAGMPGHNPIITSLKVVESKKVYGKIFFFWMDSEVAFLVAHHKVQQSEP